MLFSTDMVQALIAGRKTQTRRILKVKGCKPFVPDNSWDLETIKQWNKDYHPYGKPGDLIWVRETFKKAPEECTWKRFSYKADYNSHLAELGKWKPNIHMPKVAARIWLQVESVGVERLQVITEVDAIAEGVSRYPRSPIYGYLNYMHPETYTLTALSSFETLWLSINGLDSWDANPWVWVVKFKVVSTSGREGVSI